MQLAGSVACCIYGIYASFGREKKECMQLASGIWDSAVPQAKCGGTAM